MCYRPEVQQGATGAQIDSERFRPALRPAERPLWKA